MIDNNPLASMPLGRLIFKYSVPAIISMLVNAVYNFVDRLFIGNMPKPADISSAGGIDIGALAISGVGIALPIMTVAMAFAFLIAIGAATNMSLEMGRAALARAKAMAGNAFTLSVLTGGALTVIYFLFSDSILKLFGASALTAPYAKSYMAAIAIGFIPWLLGISLNHIIRADGSPKRSAAIMIIGALLNVPLDYLFIFVFNMGVFGAGLATVISQTISTIIGLEYYFSKRANLTLDFSSLIPKKIYLKMIVVIGITPFVLNFAMSFSQALTNNVLMKYGGDLSVGAMTTVGAILMLYFMPVFGLTQGMQPIVGFNYGARNYERAKKAFFITVLAATAFLTVGYICALFFPEPMILMFNKDPELLEITLDAIRKMALLLPTVAVSIVGTNYMLSIGKSGIALFLSLLRQILVYIPAILILPFFFGLSGVWYTLPVGDFISLIFVVAVLSREFKSYKKRA
ncbi:MAG: MATE family efflux transporter [Deferribacteraceae bacterium]|jgi:putative MATE family efflux protein|nr:MATE family efflux transporter [Deferribacteraceae bacterium]